MELVNAHFEEGWHEQGAGELVIPDGWTLEYRDGNHPWCGPAGKRPEVKPNKEHAIEGRYSVRAFPPAHSRGLFGLYQEVAVPAGTWLRFSAWARVESDPPGEMATFAGIQPWGGGLFERQMIWGKEIQAIRAWKEISVTAQAYGGRVRVALGANNKYATQNNTVWWDDCALEVIEVGETIPDVPPEIPGPFDPVMMAQLVRAVVRAELVERPPVRWPRCPPSVPPGRLK